MDKYSSGKYVSQGTYAAFVPTHINREWNISDSSLQTLLSKADRQLGRLDMYSEYIPNLDLFINMHILKEATKSSKIEGTQTNIEDALLDAENAPVERKNDVQEVKNYTKAMNLAVERMEKLPLSSKLIKMTHKALLEGVRGERKQPGNFRTSQNWIGGASINDATFVPPPHSMVNELMSDLEKFAHNESIYLPELLRIGIIHYQFETIHPFLDGNGRIGRLMIPLYLVEKGILKRPILYLSDFFERNRKLYYDNLMIVREDHNLTQWLKFFLVGVTETAKNGIETLDGLLKLQKESELKIQSMGSRSAHASQILNKLYDLPLINAKEITEMLNCSSPHAYTIIRELEERDILKPVTNAKRNKLYWFYDYIQLFD